MPVVKFVYSRSKAQSGSVVQVHDQEHEILAAGAELTYPELRKAERAFVEWFAASFPDEDLIMWEAAYADGRGRYSTYRAHLPANHK
jgi:hypothetical protein